MNESIKSKSWLYVAGMAIGSLLMLGPLLGLLGTVLGMARAFAILGKSGVGDPQALSSSIGATLLSVTTGLVMLPVGAVVLVLSIIFYVRSRPGNSSRVTS